MATKKSSKRKARHIKKRKRLWPDLMPEMVWDWEESDGFGVIPRAMPYFFKIMDDLSKNKPLSGTYFTLWCRLWDQSGLIKINNSPVLAFESGFSGNRAVSTWRTRMKKLEELGFIKSAPLGPEPYGFVVLLNPYHVVKRLYLSKIYEDAGWYNALHERADEVKATDLEEYKLEDAN